MLEEANAGAHKEVVLLDVRNLYESRIGMPLRQFLRYVFLHFD